MALGTLSLLGGAQATTTSVGTTITPTSIGALIVVTVQVVQPTATASITLSDGVETWTKVVQNDYDAGVNPRLSTAIFTTYVTSTSSRTLTASATGATVMTIQPHQIIGGDANITNYAFTQSSGGTSLTTTLPTNPASGTYRIGGFHRNGGGSIATPSGETQSYSYAASGRQKGTYDTTSPTQSLSWTGTSGTQEQLHLFIVSELVAGQTLTPSLFTNTNTHYAPTVTRGGVTLTPSLFTNTPTFYAPTVANVGGANKDIVYVGHSLVDAILNPLPETMPSDDFHFQTIVGAPLSVNWSDASSQPFNARAYSAANPLTDLVLCENNTIQPHFTTPWIETWRDNALLGNPDVRTWWYQCWETVPGSPGTFDYTTWLSTMEDYIEAHEVQIQVLYESIGLPNHPKMIPGGRAIIELYNAVDNGDITDLSDVNDIFPDGVHPGDEGQYFMTMVHYAALTGTSPVGLSNTLTSASVSAGMAADMQALAWEVVSNYPFAGIAAWPEPASSDIVVSSAGTEVSGGGGTDLDFTVDIGDQHDNKVVVAAYCLYTGETTSITGATLDGETPHFSSSNYNMSSGYNSGFLVWDMPTQSGTVTLDVTSSGDMWNRVFHVYVLDGALPTHTDINTDTSGDIDFPLDVEDGGIVLAEFIGFSSSDTGSLVGPNWSTPIISDISALMFKSAYNDGVTAPSYDVEDGLDNRIGAVGISFAPAGGGSSFPQGLTASLVTNTQTFHAPTVGRGGVNLTPSLVTNTQTFYAPTIGTAGVVLTPTLVTNTQTFYGPTVIAGGVALTPALFTNSQTFYAPTVTGAGLLAPDLFTNTQTFYGPVVGRGTITLSPDLYDDNVQIFYQPTVTGGGGGGGDFLLPPLYTNTQTFYAATVVAGSVTLTPTLFTNSQVFYPSFVGRGAIPLTAPMISNTQTFYGPTVAVGVATIAPDLFVNGQTFFNPSLNSSAAEILVPLVTNTQVFYAATVSRGTMNLTPTMVVNSQTFYAPSIAPGAVTLTPGLFTNLNSIWSPVVYDPIVGPPITSTEFNRKFGWYLFVKKSY